MLALDNAKNRIGGFNFPKPSSSACSPSETAANGSVYPSPATYTYDLASGAIHYEEYHPYGTSSYRAANSAIDVSAKRYRYTGKERDEETGLYHCGALNCSGRVVPNLLAQRADAHAVYDHLYETGKVVEVGCWGHARRYYFKALTSEPELAREGLALIDELFRIERKLVDQTPKKRKRTRLERSKPVVDTFFDWCERHANVVLDDTPIAKAIGYVTNQERRPAPLPRRRSVAHPQQRLGARTEARSGRSQELAVCRQ